MKVYDYQVEGSNLSIILSNQVCSSLNLLTTNRTLLPLDTITASSDNGNTPQELVDTSGGVWCSTQSLQTRPYIQLNFTQPVTIIYMMARGLSSSSFVSEFSIELLEESIEHLYQQPNNITVYPDYCLSLFVFNSIFSIEFPECQ